ncbi:hypothetical protein [Flaviflexus huanghaiensis]|uniref:hypothetical protein n=1 Tax=Flaviflexus huanghaiensis TaxID=1111473 RepID=UPI0015F7F9CB|nr:hypothetical protein [Flaviflexus huanghaiensis]
MSSFRELKLQAEDAVREMRDWLVRDGQNPSDVEVLGRINGPGVTFFAMQFRLPGVEDWLLGVAGGYLGSSLSLTGHTLTAYEPVTDRFGQDATDLITAMDRALTSGAVADGRKVSEFLTATLLLREPIDADALGMRLGGTVSDGTVHLGPSQIQPAPVVEDLTEIAERAYLWPRALEQTSQHRASLMIRSVGEDTFARARDHTMLVASLIDDRVLGIFANGTVYEPGFYRQVVETTPSDSPPVLALVHLGLAKRRGMLFGFTEGLADVGKDEFLLTGATPEELQQVLLELASHVLVTGIVIPDGTDLTLSTGVSLHLNRQGSGEKAVLVGAL